VAPYIAGRGSGRIVNIYGLAALNTGSPIDPIRNVGIAALTKNLAGELPSSSILVVCAHPRRTRTERIPAFVERQAKSHACSFLNAVERSQLESLQTTNAHRSCGVLVSILRPRLR